MIWNMSYVPFAVLSENNTINNSFRGVPKSWILKDVPALGIVMGIFFNNHNSNLLLFIFVQTIYFKCSVFLYHPQNLGFFPPKVYNYL